MSGKTATLNCRVNPDAKQQAEKILSEMGISMSTAIDMYLKQINLVGGIPFPITIPNTRSYEADSMSTSEIHAAIQEGIDDAESGRVKDAASVFAKFRESHS
ncbi:MAG: type II toxin-antitoxin system RelB/DinJ family antitoxin [Lachnospiraceae bacterium]|nr:type II toxin-antitoxin system RelB/DinJ family antitoxin [Lachnospiraceae bacterium]